MKGWICSSRVLFNSADGNTAEREMDENRWKKRKKEHLEEEEEAEEEEEEEAEEKEDSFT